jgi:hypothetical protein
MSVIACLQQLTFTEPWYRAVPRESLAKNREWKQARLSFYWVGLRAVLSTVRL